MCVFAMKICFIYSINNCNYIFTTPIKGVDSRFIEIMF